MSRASWQLPGPDSHRQATTSSRTRKSTVAYVTVSPPIPLGARNIEADPTVRARRRGGGTRRRRTAWPAGRPEETRTPDKKALAGCGGNRPGRRRLLIRRHQDPAGRLRRHRRRIPCTTPSRLDLKPRGGPFDRCPRWRGGPVRAERHPVHHVGVAREGADGLAGGDIPQPDRPILAGGGEDGAVGAERHPDHVVGMAGKGADEAGRSRSSWRTRDVLPCRRAPGRRSMTRGRVQGSAGQVPGGGLRRHG
jgi:hypothetical protein